MGTYSVERILWHLNELFVSAVRLGHLRCDVFGLPLADILSFPTRPVQWITIEVVLLIPTLETCEHVVDLRDIVQGDYVRRTNWQLIFVS